MRSAGIFALSITLVSLALFRPALAQGDSSESDTSQQGGAVSAMGRVGNGGKTSVQSGIEIPNYGGDISGIRRLPIGTSAPGSRDFIPAWRPSGLIVRY